MPDEPPRHGNGLPARLGSRGPLRRRGVQEGHFEGLYTKLDSWSNFLESRSGLLTPRTQGPRCIHAGVCGRRGPYVFRTVDLSTGGGDQQGISLCEGMGDQNKLRFAPSKTNTIVLIKKTKVRRPDHTHEQYTNCPGRRDPPLRFNDR
ncbi:hypothetical protein EVAR_29240_1 [Eumeta japonica]|uniref:Uncharacterized protein n=1 Tax=Eumeta variegata TaxID=151549 RepID=A0A4C1VH78_EUMVA|nr:hypothetical protein EVAR_29240_1 [Eumeta japonica]